MLQLVSLCQVPDLGDLFCGGRGSACTPPMDRALGATIIPVREKFHMLVLYVLTETTNFPRCHAEMPIWLSSNDLRNMPSWEGSALRAVYEPRGRVKLV